MNLPTKGLGQATDKDRGATMSSQRTAPDTLELVMEKHHLDLEAADIRNPELVNPVTARVIQEVQVIRLRPPKEYLHSTQASKIMVQAKFGDMAAMAVPIMTMDI